MKDPLKGYVPSLDDIYGKQKSGRPPVKQPIRKEVCFKQNYKCYNCHKKLPPTFHIHHKNPKGSNRISNLIALCPNCHAEEHHKMRLGGRKKTTKSKKKRTARRKSRKSNDIFSELRINI